MGLVHDLVEHVGPGLKEPEANTLGTCLLLFFGMHYYSVLKVQVGSDYRISFC